MSSMRTFIFSKRAREESIGDLARIHCHIRFTITWMRTRSQLSSRAYLPRGYTILVAIGRMKAVIRNSQVGEIRQVRSVNAGRGQSIREEGRCPVGGIAWSNQGIGSSCHSAQFDSNRIVLHPPPIGEPGEIAAQDAVDAGVA